MATEFGAGRELQKKARARLVTGRGLHSGVPAFLIPPARLSFEAVLSENEIAEIRVIDDEIERAVNAGDKKKARQLSKEKCVPAAVTILKKIQPLLAGNDRLHLETSIEILSDPRRFSLFRPLTVQQLVEPFFQLKEGQCQA